MKPKLHKYSVTYRIHNGYQYNDQKSFETTQETILATSVDEAYSKALARAETPSCISHDPVTVRRKDVVRIRERKEDLRDHEVSLEFLYHTTVTVKAATADDAREAVAGMSLKDIFKRVRQIPVHDLEDGQVTCVTGPDGKTTHL